MPVISTFHNGIPEDVLDGHSGFLVLEKDADALHERIVYLVEHSQDWPAMGRRGKESVEEKYNVKDCIQEQININRSC